MSEPIDSGKGTKPINEQRDAPPSALDRRSALRRMAFMAAGATLGGAALANLQGCDTVNPYSSYNSYAGSYNSYGSYTSYGGSYSSYGSYNSYNSYSSYSSYRSYSSYSSYYYYAYYDGGYLAGYPSYGNYFT